MDLQQFSTLVGKEVHKMKLKKLSAVLAAGVLAAALGIAGCSSNGGSDEPEATTDEYTLLTPGTIVFATSPDYPPFESLDESGDYVGLDIEIAKAIADKLGLQCEFKTLQFDGIIPAVQAGGQVDAGISAFSYDPERAKQVDFTENYYTDDLAIVVMNDGVITADNYAEALNSPDITIAAQSGTTGESHAQENFPNATVTGYGNATDCYAAMQSGDAAQAVVTNLAVAKAMLEAYPDATIVAEVASGEEYAIVVSQDNPGLTAAINGALAELIADGTIDALISQYMG